MFVKNFRCIGSVPVEIDLDDIVVLVGPNNAGKSTILRAYELAMNQGSNLGKITIDDFPSGILNTRECPEIELHTVIYDETVGAQWINEIEGEKIVKEKWVWTAPGDPKRQGYDATSSSWSENVPWGAPNVANSKRPQPHKVDAFADPKVQADEIVKILESVLKDRVKQFQISKIEESSEEQSEYEKLLSNIKEIQNKIIKDASTEINRIETEISSLVSKVFTGYRVKFDARPEEDLDKAVNLFKAGSQLLMGPEGGYLSNIERQGSGARRTLLWTALKYISESGISKKVVQSERPHVLLLDEPELCLHPNAIREACNVLYELPSSGNWQVMVTTHSPAFIDLSRDNTTIVRVEKNNSGNIQGTTLFRPKTAKLDENDRSNLKLLNACDPYVAEFFFGGKSVIVEGDTEYSAFKYLISENPEKYKDIHIIRARGKAIICSLVKILNQFESQYSILHDSDKPFNSNQTRNSAWTVNQNIMDSKKMHVNNEKVRLIALIPNFEQAFFSLDVKSDKPYNAIENIKNSEAHSIKVLSLLDSLVNHSCEVPEMCLEWKDLDELEAMVNKK
ncbi:ATP-dependent nuclease [Paenibacillus sp. WLX1005]|uniref:ATP-dependent nuclease n=1 Tax=Paenibacillus sp. WLX1005 TaxID=3243766 RepID=UPI0039844869